jgi:hypothetical protein
MYELMKMQIAPKPKKDEAMMGDQIETEGCIS